MSRPPSWWSSTDACEALALAFLAGGGDAGHHREIGVDDADAVAAGAGTLGVGAEQRGLDAVGLRECLADGIEQSGVRRRVAPARAADRGLVDRDHTLAGGDRAVQERALAGAGDAGDDDQHPERDVDVDVLQVVRRRAPDLQGACRRAHRVLEGGPVVEMASGDGVAGPEPRDGTFEADGPARRAGARTEVDDVVGDRDRLRLVLDHEHRVALVPQPEQQVVHALDVMWMQTRGRLVEDVGDVGERGAEVADHLHALGLAARQRARRPVQREVAEPDLGERVERVAQRDQQRRHRWLVEAADPSRQIADLHRAGVGDVPAHDPRGAGLLAEPGSFALGAEGEGDRPLHERPDVRLHRVDVLGQKRLLDLRDQALIGQVDPVDLDLGRVLVEEVVQLSLVVLADRLVRIEEPAAAEDPAVPAVHAVAGHGDRALVDRQARVVERGQVEIGDRAAALAARAHAAEAVVGRLLGLGLAAPFDRDRRRSRGPRGR